MENQSHEVGVEEMSEGEILREIEETKERIERIRRENVGEFSFPMVELR